MREALQQALEAMRKASRWIYYRRLSVGDPVSNEEEHLRHAIALSEEALRRPEQEPDCWATLTPNGSKLVSPDEAKGRKDAYPLYASPPQPEKPAARRLMEDRDELRRSQVTAHHLECGLLAAEEDRDELLSLLSALVDRCAYDGVPNDSLPVWQAAHDAVMSRKMPNANITGETSLRPDV